MMINYLQIGGAVIRIFVDRYFAEIKNAVPGLPSIIGVEYEVIVDNPLPELISYCDIVILKRAPDIHLQELRKVMRPEAKIVLCINHEEEEQIQAEEFKFLNDVWLYPFNLNRAVLRLSNLAGEILRTQEAQLHKNWLEALMNLVPDLVWFKNLEGAHLKVNKAFSRAAGKTRKMIEGKSHSEIWGGEDAGCAVSELEVLNAAEQRTFDEILVINDVPHHLKTHKAPFQGPNGTIVGTLGVAQDLTNILNLNMEIGIFVEAMPFPLILTRDDGKITYANNKFLEMFNECRDDLIDTQYSAWHEWAFENISDLIGNTLHFVHGGKNLLIQLTETPLTDSFGDPIGMVRVFMDVTTERELESQIWKAANVDALTGVANRYGFTKWVEKKISSLAHLIYLDLDNFKHVNDAFGHKAGDEALCFLADAMREVFPEDFVARLGGDEFIICICRDIDVAALTDLAEALQKKAAGYFQGSEELKTLSLSVGIRAHCEGAASVDRLIREADAAMYKAKEHGKGCVKLWTPEEA